MFPYVQNHVVFHSPGFTLQGRLSLFVYSLFDRKVGEYASLVVGPTHHAVMRALQEGLPPQSTEARYPHDFELVCLGSYDQGTGHLEPLKRPEPLGTVAEILAAESARVPSKGGADA